MPTPLRRPLQHTNLLTSTPFLICGHHHKRKADHAYHLTSNIDGMRTCAASVLQQSLLDVHFVRVARANIPT